jgi:hypothetical protein
VAVAVYEKSLDAVAIPAAPIRLININATFFISFSSVNICLLSVGKGLFEEYQSCNGSRTPISGGFETSRRYGPKNVEKARWNLSHMPATVYASFRQRLDAVQFTDRPKNSRQRIS